MKSEWRVSSNRIGDKKMYVVYRLRNSDGVDHEGNREYFGGYVEDRATAAALAANLNSEVQDGEI